MKNPEELLKKNYPRKDEPELEDETGEEVRENIENEGRKPDLAEIEDDTSSIV